MSGILITWQFSMISFTRFLQFLTFGGSTIFVQSVISSVLSFVSVLRSGSTLNVQLFTNRCPSDVSSFRSGGFFVKSLSKVKD